MPAKRRGVTYSRPNSGTDMPSKERLQARPIGRAASAVLGIRSVSFELDSSRSYREIVGLFYIGIKQNFW
jgi:hypothetical protein